MGTVPIADGSEVTTSNKGSKLTRRRLYELWLDSPFDDESEACNSIVFVDMSFSKVPRRCFFGLTLSFVIAWVFILTLRDSRKLVWSCDNSI
mmetsp:Transcript_3537/g.7350  ORF Transcript_3537/g.7350 Transcript_3537/m.7350 type:complete len:92 (-) Transcript_3537:53-328(-)